MLDEVTALRLFARKMAAKVSTWPHWKGGGVFDASIYEAATAEWNRRAEEGRET